MHRGKVVLVDDDDFERLSKYSWYCSLRGEGYAARTDKSTGKQRTVLMHREITGAKKGQLVDHINRNKLDNRKCNLRICSHEENSRNISKRKVRTTSKYKGVYFCKQKGLYMARINNSGQGVYLGYYEKEEDAAYYYNEHAKVVYGEFAALNKLPDNYIPTVPFVPKVVKPPYSKYRGVTYDKRRNRWMSRVRFNGGYKHIGSFKTERIAAEMYNVAAIEIHKENAILNVFYD